MIYNEAVFTCKSLQVPYLQNHLHFAIQYRKLEPRRQAFVEDGRIKSQRSSPFKNPPIAARSLDVEQLAIWQIRIDSYVKSILPGWNQYSEFWVIHGFLEGVMLGIVGDPIDPGGLAHSSLTQYENVDVLLVIHTQ